MTNSKSTRQNWVEKKGTCCWLAGVIGSGGLEHQRVTGESIEFGTARKWWKKHRSSKNLTRFYEISPDPTKISPNSMRFCQIWRKSLRIWWDFTRSGQNLTRSKGNSVRILVFSLDSGKFWPKSQFFARFWKSFDQFGFFGF